MLSQISIGPATVPSYPLLVLVGLWAGMWLSSKEAQRLGVDSDHVYNIGLYSLLGAILGGRLWYVITHWDAYASAPLQALALTANAIAIPEAIVVAVVVAVVYCRWHNLSLATVADALTPGSALALAIGGVGAFLGSQTLGTPTTLPWGITQFDAVRHPAHLYVVIAVLLILAIIGKIRLNARWPGFTFLLFVELYAASRLLLDPFFALPDTIGGGLRVVQVSALIALVVAIAAMARLNTQSNPP